MKVLIAFAVAGLAAAIAHRGGSPATPPTADSTASVRAFLKAYTVLESPRCMNCHPAGDAPLQGDDSHPHTQGVLRGPDGRGLYALRCANCHQPENTPGLHEPPGNPKWRLPPADMRMVFQGESPRELAAQLKDPHRNGGKSLSDLIRHVTSDTLVLEGWHMGQGRTAPPLSHEEFARDFTTWIQKGAYLPPRGSLPVQAAGEISVGGEVPHPFVLRGEDLASMPHVDVTVKDKDGTGHRYSGVPVVTVLARAGAPLGAQLRGKNMTKYLLVKAADGYEVVFALAELDTSFGEKVVVLADHLDGKPLPEKTGPYRLVVPGEKKHARWIFRVQALLVKSAAE